MAHFISVCFISINFQFSVSLSLSLFSLHIGNGILTDMKRESSPKVPIRRNLCVSLPPQSPQTVAKAHDFEGAMFPLQYTPEPAPQPALAMLPRSSSARDPNMTFELLDNDGQTASNATIIIGPASPCQAPKSTGLSGPSQPLHPPKANEANQITTKR